jgi:ATP-dependent DNA helicase MPH1
VRTHKEIQEEILHSRNLELFEDVEPLLPKDSFPACVEQLMAIDEWDPSDQKRKRKLNQSVHEVHEATRKRRVHEVPDGADGFNSVANLLREQGKLSGPKKSNAKGAKGKATKVKSSRQPQRVLSKSDEEDGLLNDIDVTGGGFKSVAELLREKDKTSSTKKGKAEDTKGKGKKKPTHQSPPVLSDSEDDAIPDLSLQYSFVGGKGNKGKVMAARIPIGKSLEVLPPPPSNRGPRKNMMQTVIRDSPSPSPEVDEFSEFDIMFNSDEGIDYSELAAARDQGAIDFFKTSGPVRKGADDIMTPPNSPPWVPPDIVRTTKGRKSDDVSDRPPTPITDENLDPIPAAAESAPRGQSTPATRARLSPRTANAAGFSQIDAMDLDDFDITPDSKSREVIVPASPSPPRSVPHRNRPLGLARPRPSSSAQTRIGLPSSLVPRLNPPALLTHSKSRDIMPPPPVPAPQSSPPISEQPETPNETQFPVRRHRRAMVVPSSSERPSPTRRLVFPLGTDQLGRDRRLPTMSSDFDSSPIAHRRPPAAGGPPRRSRKEIGKKNGLVSLVWVFLSSVT